MDTENALPRFIMSSKNKPLLVDTENFVYRKQKDSERGDKTYYMCLTPGCKARVHCAICEPVIIPGSRLHEHNHLASPYDVNQQEFKAALVDKAKTTNFATRKVYMETKVENWKDW